MAPARKSSKKSATRKSQSKAVAKRSKAPSTRSSASKKSASRKKASTSQATRKKAAAKKAVAAPAAKAAPTKGKAAGKGPKGSKAAQVDTRGGRRAPAIRSRKKKQPHVKPPALTGSPSERHVKLGIKWACFGCGTKFYDLNQPEPLCPRCGADQREKPADAPRPPPPPPPKREPRSLAPYLDDDDAATRDESLTSDDLELELGAIDDDSDVDDSNDLGLDDADTGTDEE